ncbi:MAG: hypothetical protein AAGA85_16105 [Bacteroidota bacterium]
MKILQLSFVVTVCLTSITGCSLECQSAEDIQVTFLVDISDERLLEAARDDMQNNLGAFMADLGLASMEDCQQLTVNMAPLSARDELKLVSQRLSLVEKGLSARERRRRTNPQPIVQMIGREFSTYDSLRRLPAYNQGSSIGNQMLKAIHQTREASKSYVVVFSDMVQHDEHISFYRELPEQINASSLQMLFDPLMLDRVPRGHQDTQVIIVHLQQVDTSMKGKRRAIAALWSEAFEQGLGIKVVVKDNLTQ